MVNWTEVEALANTCLVLTSAGAIGYAGLQLRHEREYRSVSNLEKQLGFFQTEAFTAARRRLAKDRLTEDCKELRGWEIDDPPVSAFEVLDFYEHIGLLVKKGHLQIYDVWHTFYEWAQPVYLDMQPLIESEESAYRDHYSDLRKLMRHMDDIQLGRMYEKNSNANHWALWTPDRILGHYRYELEAAGQSGRGKRSAERAAERRREQMREEQERLDLDAGGEASGKDVLDGGTTDERETRRQRWMAEETLRKEAALNRWERMRHARGQ